MDHQKLGASHPQDGTNAAGSGVPEDCAVAPHRVETEPIENVVEWINQSLWT